VREIREELLMSKAELARKAGVSPLTIDRIEKGKSCRMETRRKIILALGYGLTDKDRIFPRLTRVEYLHKKSTGWTGYRSHAIKLVEIEDTKKEGF
jgi:DNA-binding XRE family transcriptional regulator